MPHAIDEYTLAAFLAGTLPEERRTAVIAYLAESEDARELLCMAEEALGAAREPAVPPTPPPERDKEAEPSRAAASRLPFGNRLRRMGLYVFGTVLILVFGISLSRLIEPSYDTFRGAEEPSAFVAQVTTPALAFQWPPVEEAYYYRLVITDEAVADIVSRHETRETRLDSDDAFIVALRSEIIPGRTYSIRIDAVDAQNRLIQSAPSVFFSLPE